MDGTHHFEVVSRATGKTDWQITSRSTPVTPAALDHFVPACLTGDCPICAAPKDGQEEPSGFLLPPTAGDPVAANVQSSNQPLRHALVTDIIWPSPTLIRLLLEPAEGTTWSAGQTIFLHNPKGIARPYAVASPAPAPDDPEPTMEVHARHRVNGVVSDYLAGLLPGDILDVSEPLGHATYSPAMAGHPLLLVGSGTAIGALAAIALTALDHGHQEPVRLIHGSSGTDPIYMQNELTEIAIEHANFTYDCLPDAHGTHRAILDAAFDGESDLSDHILFLRGAAALVAAGRTAALRQGACIRRILDTPYFAYRDPSPAPDRLAASDPELWEALGCGEKLGEILDDFSARQGTPPNRADQTRAAIADLFTGARLRSVPADLFGGADDLFFEVARDHGLSDDTVSRWREAHARLRGG
jgi:NAD(P)H-flavin reductase